MALRVHHLGIVVANIEAYLTRSLWRLRGAVVTDPLQQARLCLTCIDGTDGPLIELVEPQGDTSPTWKALQRGGGWHHLCLSVATKTDGDALLQQRQWLPVTEWTPAVLFGGRAVRFAYSRNRELLELVTDAPED
jgi:hypothetical protein